jgi:hypothetical protein
MTPGLPADLLARLANSNNNNNIQLTLPLAPPVSREAGCFLTFKAARCNLACNNILSSLIICLQVGETTRLKVIEMHIALFFWRLPVSGCSEHEWPA